MVASVLGGYSGVDMESHPAQLDDHGNTPQRPGSDWVLLRAAIAGAASGLLFGVFGLYVVIRHDPNGFDHSAVFCVLGGPAIGTYCGLFTVLGFRLITTGRLEPRDPRRDV